MSLVRHCFDRIFVINLPTRADRRRDMAAQLRSVGLELGQGPVELFPAIRPAAADGFPSVGTRGCFMSHLQVLRTAAERGYRRILVFEDDLNFVADFNDRFDGLAAVLDKAPWSYFYGGFSAEREIQADYAPGLARIPQRLDVVTAHFLAFQGEAISGTAAYLEALLTRPPGDPRGGPMHVDGAYFWYRRDHPEQLTLAAVPQLGYQRSSRTDIHDLRWFDRLPAVRDAVALARRVKTRLRHA